MADNCIVCAVIAKKELAEFKNDIKQILNNSGMHVLHERIENYLTNDDGG